MAEETPSDSCKGNVPQIPEHRPARGGELFPDGWIVALSYRDPSMGSPSSRYRVAP